MSATEIVILVLVLLVVAAVAAVMVVQANKRKHLQSRFGPEYDRTVQQSGRRDAERELAEREQRRQSLDIRPLPETDRVRYAERWRTTQADFVDHPEQAVRQADALVTEVLGRRGYPVGDFEQMSRDVSVDHADTVSQYRAAHDISERNDRQQASTEQLRQAMVHYRTLFDELLADGGPSGGERVHDDRQHDDRQHDDRVHEDRVHEDRVPDDRAVTPEPAYATDEDRRFDPIDTSRADGVRVEPGGLGRGRGGDEFEHDLPRDDRPRT